MIQPGTVQLKHASDIVIEKAHIDEIQFKVLMLLGLALSQ